MATATAKRTTKKLPPADIDKLCKTFHEAQQRFRKTHDESLLALLEMGESLAVLKEAVGPGGWLRFLEEQLHIAERYAQHLMGLVNTPLAKQIRAKDTDLLAQLPLDVRVLDHLAKLPTAKLKKALRDWDLAELSRRQIERMVNEALGLETKIRNQPTVAPATNRVETNGQEHVDGKLDCDEPDEEQVEHDQDDDLSPDADSEESDKDTDGDSSQAEDDDRDSESTQDLDDDGNPVDEMDLISDAIDFIGTLDHEYAGKVLAALGNATAQQREKLCAKAAAAINWLGRICWKARHP